MRLWLLAGLLALGIAGSLPAQMQPLLQLQGQPYFGGSMKLHLTGTVGQPALLAYGLNPLPLDQPIQTGKGPWFIGSMVNLVALGNIPSGGRLDLSFTMPPLMPALAGIPVVMQGYVPWQLSNPATLPLDMPYCGGAPNQVLAAPTPIAQAEFGDRAVVGDLNADGYVDIVVGAPLADYPGADRAGRVYVFWGPDHLMAFEMIPPSPKDVGLFGASVTVADMNGDTVDDLIVAEGCGGDPPSSLPGHLYVYSGGQPFVAVPATTVSSVGVGSVYEQFGRSIAVSDYNGDTALDIAVGLPNASDGAFISAGKIDVYWGPSYTTILTIFSPDPLANDFFGSRLAASDIDSDGVGDLLESSGREDVGSVVNQGRAHVFLGPSLSTQVTIDDPLPGGSNSRFGSGIMGTDARTGAPSRLIISDEKGHVFAFVSPTLNLQQVIYRPPDSYGGLASSSFGYYMGWGDLNGDGLLDIAVTDIFAGNPGCALSGGGLVFVALAPYFETFLAIEEFPSECGAEFGTSVVLADIDGNGLLDVVTGADLADHAGVPNSGRVSLWKK